MTTRLDIDAQVDVAGAARLFAFMRERAPVAVASALNKTLAEIGTEARRRIARELGLRQRTVRRNFIQARAGRDHLEAQLLVVGRPLPIKRLRARQTRLGVTYRLPGGGRALIRSAFIVPRLGGHVFRRRGRARLPIAKQVGPSIPQVFAEQRIAGVLRERVADVWRKKLAQELRFRRARV